MAYTLYSYWRSSASWRVRIALHLKGLEYVYVPVNLLRGEQRGDEHRARNPMAQVPSLDFGDLLLNQSVAILEALDERHPEPPLLPSDWADRARARALAEMINAGIQPLQNLRITKHIASLGGDKQAWGREVIQDGLAAVQDVAQASAGRYLVGNRPTVADLHLVPQLYNARRFGCDLDSLPLLTAIEARCEALPAFAAAHPDRQPDAVET